MMYKKLQLQRQSSAAHRRTPPFFIGAIQFDSREEDVWRHDPTKDMPFRSATSGTSSSHNCSPESKIDLKHRLGDDDDETLRALELIRELSFDSGTEKRRARIDTSSTDRTSSSSECDASSQTDRHNNTDHIDTSPIGLDLKLKHILQSRMDSPKPFVGLQYLPELGGRYTDQFV